MRLRTIPGLVAVIAALFWLAACDLEMGDMGRYSKDFHFSYPLNASGNIELDTFNGSVEITGWDQNTVDISGTKYGPTPEIADALEVKIDPTPAAISIRAVRPADRRGNQGAKFILRVPRTAVLDRIGSSNGSIHTQDGAGPARLRTSNGSIQVVGLRGNVDAQTSNASVELTDVDGDAVVHSSNGHIRAERLRGSLQGSTSNASINANLDRARGPVRLDTSNGGIDLRVPPAFANEIHAGTTNAGISVHLPRQTDARVSARTSNASISSDFEMKVQGEFSKNRLEGTIGQGGSLYELTTSNGSIKLIGDR